MASVPTHVAIILDGNGRWAKKQKKPRTYGHAMGAKRVEPTCRFANKMGIKYLTIYAFSTENWNRPQAEVAALMRLLAKYMRICHDLAVEENMRARIIGDKSGLPEKLLEEVRILESDTKDNTGLSLQICINYGSRDEMVRGMRKMYEKFTLEGKSASEITEVTFSSFLDAPDVPDPDLLIRTSGEQRISNFLLWQLAYAEFYFTPVPWPEFDEAEFMKALDAYTDRDRRYGKI